MRFFQKFSATAFTVFVSAIVATTALAVGVKPVRTELIIDPGASASATIRVINSEEVAVKVRPEIVVYTANDAKGYPISVELDEDDPLNIYDWIEYPDEIIEIPANSEEIVEFTVSVPADAAPGGRYASIMYTAIDDLASGGVKIEAAVPSLILVKVSGEEIHSSSLVDFKTSEKLLGDATPLLEVNFQNDGNVHEKPSGSVTIFTEGGEQLTQIAKYRHPVSGELITADAIPVNLDGGNVLPGSSRIFTADWNENISEGKFTAKLSFEYEDGQPELTSETEFEIRDELNLKSFEISELENTTSFTITVENLGNVFEKLEGKIEVVNEFASVVASPEIPVGEEVGYLAPGSTTTITVPWLEKTVPAGEFTATLQANYGFFDEGLSAEIQFGEAKTDLTIFLIGGGVAFAILLIVVIVLLFRRRKTVAQSQPIDFPSSDQ